MKVKELLKLLENVNPEADAVAAIAGTIYPISLTATEEQLELSDPKSWAEVQLICGEWI